MVAVRSPPAAAGAGAAGGGGRDGEQHRGEDGGGGGAQLRGAAGRGGEPGQDAARPVLRGGPGRGEGVAGQGGERGDLQHAGGDPGGGADFLEAEQADPDRQQVAAEGGQGEPGRGGGGEPAAQRQHRQGEAERGDDLQQEQPADGRDGPVTGQVQVQVDRPAGDQQPRAGQQQRGPDPAGPRRRRIVSHGSGRSCHRGAPSCHLLFCPVVAQATAGPARCRFGPLLVRDIAGRCGPVIAGPGQSLRVRACYCASGLVIAGPGLSPASQGSGRAHAALAPATATAAGPGSSGSCRAVREQRLCGRRCSRAGGSRSGCPPGSVAVTARA